MSRIHSIVTITPAGEEEGIPRYPDKGCELAPRCLECPLPRCRFDSVEGKQWRRRPKGIPNRRKSRGSRVEKSGSRVEGKGPCPPTPQPAGDKPQRYVAG